MCGKQWNNSSEPHFVNIVKVLEVHRQTNHLRNIKCLKLATRSFLEATCPCHHLTHPTWMAPLKERRQQATLMLFSKALTNYSAISLSHLSHPSRTTRTLDETCFFSISTRTDVYKFAFFPSTSLVWNSSSLEFHTKSLQTPPGMVESHP
jgi:hypothetical protein